MVLDKLQRKGSTPTDGIFSKIDQFYGNGGNKTPKKDFCIESGLKFSDINLQKKEHIAVALELKKDEEFVSTSTK